MFKCKDCDCNFEEPQTKRKLVQVVDDWLLPYTETFAFDCCPECESENIEDYYDQETEYEDWDD